MRRFIRDPGKRTSGRNPPEYMMMDFTPQRTASPLATLEDDVRRTSIISQVIRIPLVSQTPQVPQAPQISQASRVSQAPRDSRVPRVPHAPRVSQARRVLQAPLVPQIPRVLQVSEDLQIPRVPQAPPSCKYAKMWLILIFILLLISFVMAVGMSFWIWYQKTLIQMPIVDSPTCWTTPVHETPISNLGKPVSITSVGVWCKYPATENEKTSYPKDFNLVGYYSNDVAMILGEYRYDRDKPGFQLFNVSGTPLFNQVSVRFISNWGNSNNTCIENVTVYGRVITQP